MILTHISFCVKVVYNLPLFFRGFSLDTGCLRATATLSLLLSLAIVWKIMGTLTALSRLLSLVSAGRRWC